MSPSPAPAPATYPAGWRRITNNAFSFMAPGDLTETPADGIDSYVGVYDSKTLHVGFDYGRWSDPSLASHVGAARRGDFTMEAVIIDGRKATLGVWLDDEPEPRWRARRGCGVYVEGPDGDHLQMTIWSREDRPDECRAMLRSIVFDGDAR